MADHAVDVAGDAGSALIAVSMKSSSTTSCSRSSAASSLNNKVPRLLAGVDGHAAQEVLLHCVPDEQVGCH